MGGRSDRRGPQERPLHPPGRNGVEEPGAARLAGAAGGPRRERRPLPRTGGHKKAAAKRRPHQTAAQPLKAKGRPPSGAAGSAASHRASSVGRQLSSAPKLGAPPGYAAGVPAGPRSGAAPCPASACSLRHKPRSVFRAYGPTPAIVTEGRDSPGLGRSAQRAIERGRASREAPRLT